MAFIPRIFVEDSDIENKKIFVGGADANHILRVLRKTVGDTVTVCGGGSVFSASIEKTADEGLYLSLGEELGKNNEMPFDVTVYQCNPKGDKLDTVVRKAVELGASEIVVVLSERCVARPDNKSFASKLERMNKISESAAAQCGRSFIPKVRGLISYKEAISEMKNSDISFVCYEGDGVVQLPKLLSGEPKSISFLIGPEGGISEKEISLAESENIALAGLGKRILRTETASGYVLSAISVLLELK